LVVITFTSNFFYETFFDFQNRVNPHFEMMFEMGVDEMSWDDTVRNFIRLIFDDDIHINTFINGHTESMWGFLLVNSNDIEAVN